jgi:hypothetical protein
MMKTAKRTFVGNYDDLVSLPAANTVDPVDDTASACCSHWDTHQLDLLVAERTEAAALCAALLPDVEQLVAEYEQLQADAD